MRWWWAVVKLQPLPKPHLDEAVREAKPQAADSIPKYCLTSVLKIYNSVAMFWHVRHMSITSTIISDMSSS